MEQGTGIEPAFTAWEAVVLPIYEPCIGRGIIADAERKCKGNFAGGWSSQDAAVGRGEEGSRLSTMRDGGGVDHKKMKNIVEICAVM